MTGTGVLKGRTPLEAGKKQPRRIPIWSPDNTREEQTVGPDAVRELVRRKDELTLAVSTAKGRGIK